MTIIRLSTPEDEASIREVCRQAFGGEDEGRLVDALREAGYERLSLVAEKDGDVVGVVVFSELAIVTESASIAGLALAPLAVLPPHQRSGLGRCWSREGLRSLSRVRSRHRDCTRTSRVLSAIRLHCGMRSAAEKPLRRAVVHGACACGRGT